MKLFFLSLLSLCTVAAFSQDYRGCHHFKNVHAGPRAKELTAAERLEMEASILRSDTIDISHYDIVIDVTAYSQQYINAATTITYAAKMPGVTSI